MKYIEKNRTHCKNCGKRSNIRLFNLLKKRGKDRFMTLCTKCNHREFFQDTYKTIEDKLVKKVQNGEKVVRRG